mgnify:CR=1 FL=1
MNSVRLTLLKKALIFFSILLIPAGLIYVFAYFQNKKTLERYVLEDLAQLAEAYEGQVFQFLEMAKKRAVDFSSDGFIREQLAGAMKKGGPSAALNEHLAKNKLSLDKSIRSIHVLTLNGRVVASTEASSIGKDSSLEPYFKNGRYGTSVTEGLFLEDNLPMLAISTPIKRGFTGDTIGVLVNFISLNELDRILSNEFKRDFGAISLSKGRKKTLEVCIVNKDSLLLTRAKAGGDNEILKQAVTSPPVGACLQSNKEVAGFYKNSKGAMVAGASMCLPELKWVLIVEVSEHEALAPIKAVRNSAAAVALFMVAIAVLIIIAFYRLLVQKIKKLYDATEQISSGNYDISLPVESGDEIGALQQTFNAMASELKKRGVRIIEGKRRLSEAQRIARIGMWEYHIEQNNFFFSNEAATVLGWLGIWSVKGLEDFLSSVQESDRDALRRAFDASIFTKKPLSAVFRVLMPNAAIAHIRMEAAVAAGPEGAGQMLTGIVQDITGEKEREFELKKLSMAIEESANLVFITDRNGTIEYVNPLFEQVTGYSKDEAIGQNPRILSSGDTPNELYRELWSTILSGRTWRDTHKNKKKTGGFYWCNCVISPIINDKGEITHFLSIQEDITEKMQSEEKLSRIARHDELTGFYNRARFLELLDEWLANAILHDATGGLLLIDIDHFKFINDTYGHGIGDDFLRRVSVVINSTIDAFYVRHVGQKEKPLLSRPSGDEFAAFLPHLSEAQCLGLAEEIKNSIALFRYKELSLSATISLGIALYPEHGANSRTLLTKADTAMYRAKELGRNRGYMFREEDKDLEKMHSRLSWRDKILTALNESRFVPWFQPILNLKTGTVSHYEALARLKDENGNIILPGAFIEVAERFGLIGSIDRMITEKTMQIQSRLQRAGRKLSFGLNLSAKDLTDEEFLSFIKEKISDTGADPDSFIFEITETAAISDLARAVKFIKALKTIGCHFSLDDFGVGFTSFIYLREMGVDYIKIDGAFIRKLKDNPTDRVFVKALSDVARGLNIKSVAEFVENEEIIKLLVEFSVDYAQGFAIGKPAPEPEHIRPMAGLA